MDPVQYLNSRLAMYQNYDPMQEARLKYMYELAQQNPNNADLAMSYNQAYMDYMYPQGDPLMAALDGGGQMDATQYFVPTMQSAYGNNGSYTQDQLNQYRKKYNLGNDWVPEGISIEVPDNQGDNGGGTDWRRTLLTPIAEPYILGSSILGSKAGGASWQDAIDYGVSDYNKGFQEQNLIGQLSRGLMGEERAKRAYQVPFSQQWNELF